MSKNQPTMNAYVVDKREGSDDAYWTKVGVVFEHEDGKGYNLVLTPGISVAGRIVLRERKPADAKSDE